MTDQTVEATDEIEGAEGAEGTAEQEEGGSRLKRVLVFFVLPLLLVLGTAAGVYFSGAADGLFGTSKEDAAAVEKARQAEVRASAVFFDLPELLVNLNSSGRRTHFLKISISLELPGEANIRQLQLVMPRIIDSFQVYLRELRVSDLQGSAGIYRLREDLLRRVNEAAAPVAINDVLFKEMLIQ